MNAVFRTDGKDSLMSRITTVKVQISLVIQLHTCINCTVKPPPPPSRSAGVGFYLLCIRRYLFVRKAIQNYKLYIFSNQNILNTKKGQNFSKLCFYLFREILRVAKKENKFIFVSCKSAITDHKGAINAHIPFLQTNDILAFATDYRIKILKYLNSSILKNFTAKGQQIPVNCKNFFVTTIVQITESMVILKYKSSSLP